MNTFIHTAASRIGTLAAPTRSVTDTTGRPQTTTTETTAPLPPVTTTVEQQPAPATGIDKKYIYIGIAALVAIILLKK